MLHVQDTHQVLVQRPYAFAQLVLSTTPYRTKRGQQGIGTCLLVERALHHWWLQRRSSEGEIQCTYLKYTSSIIEQEKISLHLLEQEKRKTCVATQ